MLNHVSHRWFGPILEEKFPNTCFVIMPFSTPWAPQVWDVVGRAFTHEGFNCIRADSMGGQIVLKDIVEGIARSQLLVADVTGANHNVFYEIGIAHAWEFEVLLIGQKGSQIPFDLESFRRLFYELGDDGLRKLGYGLRQYARDKSEGPITPSTVAIDYTSTQNEPAYSFLGQWEGVWQGDIPGALSHTLVVQTIHANRASVLYFWGNCPEWQIKAGSRRMFGMLDGSFLRLEWPSVVINYTVRGNELLGARTDEAGAFHCALSKIR
jgi:hypothetical protein